MVEVLAHDRCTGCAACFSACAHRAISMKYDNEGFEYPYIDTSRCVDCGLCQIVCPVIQYSNKNELRNDFCDIQRGYAARNVNIQQREISSSGSIFPPIAEWIIDKGGVVIGTAFDDSFNAKHQVARTKDDIVSLQGSKYLQCKADNTTFKFIRDELRTGKYVLYSGMACQVEGLKSFLRTDYDNLYTIDLVCMGIPSPMVWQKYLRTFFGNEHILHVNFKEKSIGWDSFCFYIRTDKREYKERGMKNLYLQSMFKSWNMRPSCFRCPFKKRQRFSDFTLADCWGVYKKIPEINDNKGLSSVIVHSKKGYNLWQELANKIDFVEVDMDEIRAGNPYLVLNKQPIGNRELFYKILNEHPYKAFQKLCIPQENNIQSIIKKIKRLFV